MKHRYVKFGSFIKLMKIIPFVCEKYLIFVREIEIIKYYLRKKLF